MVDRRKQPLTARRWSRVGVGAGLVAAVAVAIVAFRPVAARFSGQFPQPREAEPARRATGGGADYVGAERCADCHAAEYAVWRQSTHGRAGGPPSQQTVIAAFDGTSIRFANAEVVPRVRQGTYEFVIREAGDSAQTIRVDGVVGGGHMHAGGTQAFVADRGDGTWRMLPFEWSRQSGTWFCNTNSRAGQGWTRITPVLRLQDCGDWPPIRVLGDHPRYANCQSCHASQALVAFDSTKKRYETTFTSLAINCESCHGPGQKHVQVAERGDLGASADVGFTALATLDKDASIGVCYQCHAVKDQLRPEFASGDSLPRYYSTKLPLLGDRPLHPDGRIRTFAYQEGHQYSDCYLNGGMTCVSCHDPHSQQYRTVTGVALAGRFDDTQCTSCHLSKADNPTQHTKHAAPSTKPHATDTQPQAPSCVSCHMPARQEPDTRALNARYVNSRVVPYARSDHTVSIPRPQVDSALGLATACVACHAGTSTAEQEQRIRAWWGAVKPLPATVAAQLRFRPGMPASSAAPLLLGDTADGGGRHAFARFAGVSRFLENYVSIDMDLPRDIEERVRDLATSTDDDIRAAALATLHLAKGNDRGVRRSLASALRAAGARDAALRDRWTVMLGFIGDRYAERDDFGNAIAAYTRALEVQPSNARLVLSLANAQRNAGNGARAVTSYQRAIALDPSAPLAWVNLGIALTELGDVQGATTALVRAAALDATEPLAWFNLANLLYVRRDMEQARTMYERVVALDPSIVPAQFQLARVSLMKGDSGAALRHLRRGLAFDSSDAQARQMAAFLTNRPVLGTRARP